MGRRVRGRARVAALPSGEAEAMKRTRDDTNRLLIAGILLSGFVALMAYGAMQVPVPRTL